MCKTTIIKLIFILLFSTGLACCAESAGGSSARQKISQTPTVEEILERLNKKTSELKSFQCDIEYRYIQKLPESQALRKGTLYYKRADKKSALRINFDRLKYDEESEQKYKEQYIVVEGSRLNCPGMKFEGIWLAHLDYEISEIKYYQLAEPNDSDKSFDVFELASKNIPMVGFSKIDDLKKEFEIELIKPKQAVPEDEIQIHLKVKPNSVYKDDYISIDVWIDRKLGLPVKISAVTTEPEPPYGDIYEIKLIKPKVNTRIADDVFDFKIPAGFGEPEIIPIQKNQ
jgi:outer membrane lipoprotein-sorting protein